MRFSKVERCRYHSRLLCPTRSSVPTVKRPGYVAGIKPLTHLDRWFSRAKSNYVLSFDAILFNEVYYPRVPFGMSLALSHPCWDLALLALRMLDTSSAFVRGPRQGRSHVTYTLLTGNSRGMLIDAALGHSHRRLPIDTFTSVAKDD